MADVKPSVFRDLTLREAEAELVGACIDHEMALRIALILLPVDDFRSEVGEDMRSIFYVLTGWLSKGLYDEETNRERLALYFPDLWVDGIWCPYGAVDEYVEALCGVIVRSNNLFDRALAAEEEWRLNNPLSLESGPPPTVRTTRYVPKQRGKGGAAGIMIDFPS